MAPLLVTPSLSADRHPLPLFSGSGAAGVLLFGTSSAALGLVDLRWGSFATVWQPVPQDLALVRPLAYLAATAMLFGGIAVQFRRLAVGGAIALCVPYAAFALLWAKRVVLFPSIFATWSGTAEELALLVAAIVIFGRSGGRPAADQPTLPLPRLALGLCVLSFGVAHFMSLAETAAMVPAWLPGTGRAWAIATGLADVLGAAALVTGTQSQLAAGLLAAMYAVFAALVWGPAVLAEPGSQMGWAGAAVTLAMAGAVLTVGVNRRSGALAD